MGKLEGKIALITGGANGLGKSHIEKFVNEGATVIFTDIDEASGVALAGTIGEQAEFIKQDVAEEEDWAAVIKHIDEKYGRLDILVNNAGVASSGTIEDTTIESFKKIMLVNYYGVFLGLKFSLPLLKKGENPSVINVASVAALRTAKGITAAYTSSKHAVKGLTGSAAREFGEQGIRVNGVYPGFMQTEMLFSTNTPEQIEEISASVPLHRLGKPEDVSNVIAFLASDEAAYINGGIYTVDGGFIL